MSPGPFGASVQGARNLVVAVGTTAGVPIGASGRAPAVSDDTMVCWLEEAGSRVLISIPGYEALPPSTVDQVETTARGLVHFYAASLLADVLHPERAGPAGKSLSDSLMQRFADGLNSLTATVMMEIDLLPDSESPIVGATDFGAAGRFPPPSGITVRGF